MRKYKVENHRAGEEIQSIEHKIANETKGEQIKALEATFKKLGWCKEKEIRKIVPPLKLKQDESLLFAKSTVVKPSGTPEKGWLIGTTKAIYQLGRDGKQQCLELSNLKQLTWDNKIAGLVQLDGSSHSLDLKRLVGRKAELVWAAFVQLCKLVNPSIDVVRQDRCATCGRKLGWLSPRDEINGRHFCSRQCITKYQESKEREEWQPKWEEKQRKRKEARAKREEAHAKEQALREEKRRKKHEKEQSLRDKITSEPSNPVAYFELGQFLFEQTDKMRQARESYTKALALGLSDPIQKGIAHHDLGCDCYYGGHDRRWLPNITSREAFSRSYPYKPTPEQVYHLEEAAKEFNIALKSNPDDMETAQHLAHIYGAISKEREQGKMLVLVEEIKARKSLQARPPLGVKNEIQDKTGLSFEEKCLKLLERLGFTCRRTAITGDGGIDIIATSNQPLFSGTYIVQCKNWKNPVGEPPVRDLYGVVMSENANKGILITSSTFTDAAQNFARGKNIELLDGDQLEQLIQQYLSKA